MKRGLSLLEVIIALAILAGSAAVLSQLMSLGQRHALRQPMSVRHNPSAKIC